MWQCCKWKALLGCIALAGQEQKHYRDQRLGVHLLCPVLYDSMRDPLLTAFWIQAQDRALMWLRSAVVHGAVLFQEFSWYICSKKCTLSKS